MKEAAMRSARRNAALIALLVTAAVALAACGTVAPPTPPSMTGFIQVLTPGSAQVTSVSALDQMEILVIGKGVSDRALVRIDGSTRLLRERGGHVESAMPNEVVAGAKVDVWFDGPVSESYPIGAHAGTLLIHF
jgi:hypothetical protein